MEHRQLGRSGLQVPVLSLGTGTFGGKGEFFQKWGDTDAKEATKLVDICLEHGLNFFDTADMYGSGANEKLLGKAFKGQWDKVVLATKFGVMRGPNGEWLGINGQPEYIKKCCDQSLKNLNTEVIDLYRILSNNCLRLPVSFEE